MTTIDITRAQQIEGWMSDVELTWLATEAAKRTRIVEIGSHLGRSTRAMADATAGRVVAIDSWVGPNDASIPYAERLTIQDRFTTNLKDLIDAGKVKPVMVDHADLRSVELTEPPDMIFIDGSHEYDAVKRDIAWALGHIRRAGGLLCGHDIDRLSVEQAVRDTVGMFRIGGGRGNCIWFQIFSLRPGAAVRGSRG